MSTVVLQGCFSIACWSNNNIYENLVADTKYQMPFILMSVKASTGGMFLTK